MSQLLHDLRDGHSYQKLTARSQGRRLQYRPWHDSLEIVVEGKVVIATAALVVVTWLLYKLAEWLEPRK